jgi:tRNA A-37 threonylcarbamoyl transferase component Bud32
MPWALVEDRSWWIPGEGAVIMEDLQGAEPLNRYAARFFARGMEGDPRRRREFAGSVARFFRGLHAGEIFHKDVKATNLLVQQDGDGWRIALVDLDHVRFDKPLRKREQARNLAQLHASIPPCVGSTYRWRFLQACLHGKSREALRSMAAEVVKISRAR